VPLINVGPGRVTIEVCLPAASYRPPALLPCRPVKSGHIIGDALIDRCPRLHLCPRLFTLGPTIAPTCTSATPLAEHGAPAHWLFNGSRNPLRFVRTA